MVFGSVVVARLEGLGLGVLWGLVRAWGERRAGGEEGLEFAGKGRGSGLVLGFFLLPRLHGRLDG